MNDIATRLRIKDDKYTDAWAQRLMDEAADEIEHLRAALARHGFAADCDDYDCQCRTCVVPGCQCSEATITAPAPTTIDQRARDYRARKKAQASA
jgi:hypothetical protein